MYNYHKHTEIHYEKLTCDKIMMNLTKCHQVVFRILTFKLLTLVACCNVVVSYSITNSHKI